MAFNYPQLLAHLCQTRKAGAGAVVSAGGIANKEIKKGFPVSLSDVTRR